MYSCKCGFVSSNPDDFILSGNVNFCIACAEKLTAAEEQREQEKVANVPGSIPDWPVAPPPSATEAIEVEEPTAQNVEVTEEGERVEPQTIELEEEAPETK